MSKSTTATQAASAISDMEYAVLSVERWASLLLSCGMSENSIPAEAIYVVGEALSGIAQQLKKAHGIAAAGTRQFR
jgi:hypothetical protein